MSLDTKFISLMEDNISKLPTPGNVELGLTREERVKSLETFNSVLAGLVEVPASNPYYMVEKIKKRLELTLGLTFDDTFYMAGDSGKTVLPLIDVNVVFTHSNLDGRVRSDNGFLKRFPHGLVLHLSWVTFKNITHVDVNIMESSIPTPISVNEKAG